MLTADSLALLDSIWSRHAVDGAFRRAMAQTLQRREYATAVAQLPTLMCQALGGDLERARPVTTAWQLLRSAGRLLDDIEDGDADESTLSSDLNAATGLIFSAVALLSSLERLGVLPRTARAIRDRFNATALQICSGQHFDLTLKQVSLRQSWQIARAKTGIVGEVGCWAGARLVVDDDEMLAAAAEFGCCLGMMAQIKDDVEDLWDSDGGRSDLVQLRRASLPLAYSLEVLPEIQRKRLLANLIQAASSAHAAARAREMIVASGAALYLGIQSTVQFEHGARALQRLAPAGVEHDRLLQLLQQSRLVPVAGSQRE